MPVVMNPDPDYNGYNQLQTIAYDTLNDAKTLERSKLEELEKLLAEYEGEGTAKLREELAYINRTAPEGSEPTEESILQVAMRTQEAFQLCCQFALKCPGLLSALLIHQDMDGDTVLHQLINFNRAPACEALRTVISSMEVGEERTSVIEVICKLLDEGNKKGETPRDLVAERSEGKGAIIEQVEILEKTVRALLEETGAEPPRSGFSP
ncbi:MAG: hypothetical protein A3E87_10775 [Gammaproteobacteria bacterium RIFCSPHIGHO2_12_FULL_35_23]|nr:MAG: hypothetical protein A3E87_10775 [Gammaproteobacteria bacterium RIFCSPHIGHO2_12_FULL_35_23]